MTDTIRRKSRFLQHSDAPMDEAKAAAIIAEFRAEWPSVRTGHRSRSHGCTIRYRNRLVREAGYDGNQAYDAIAAIAYAKGNA